MLSGMGNTLRHKAELQEVDSVSRNATYPRAGLQPSGSNQNSVIQPFSMYSLRTRSASYVIAAGRLKGQS